MEQNIDVGALASLARLDVSDEELARLETEIPAILEFVEIIQKANVSKISETHAPRNVMRDDAGAHESAIYTEALLSSAPAREGNRIAVKQVLTRKGK